MIRAQHDGVWRAAWGGAGLVVTKGEVGPGTLHGAGQRKGKPGKGQAMC